MQYYAKIYGDPTYWLVKDGKRQLVESPAQMHGFGLFEVRVLLPEQLEAIPLVCQEPEKKEVEQEDEDE